MGKRVDPARLNAMREMYEAGADLKEVGTAFGVTLAAVANLFRRNGIEARPKGYNLIPPYIAAAMCREYEAGMSTTELGAKYGRHPNTINHLLHRNGVQMRPARSAMRVPDERVQAMREMYEAGASLREVGDKYGCSDNAVRMLFERRGIKRRPKGYNLKARK